MSADFWAGYISGAVGILIGNPLDLIKVRLQAAKETTTASSSSTSTSPNPPTRRAPYFPSRSALVAGTAAPVLGYGALNALLFVSYNRTEALLNESLGRATGTSGSGSNLWTTWIAGAVGGLATWAVSTPTELVKCRAQVLASSTLPSLSSALSLPGLGPGSSSWAIAKHILRTEGIRGLYLGGAVTALRDSIGYGFYFWSYELGCRWAEEYQSQSGSRSSIGREQGQPVTLPNSFFSLDAAKILLCGGVAGVITWASVFPLDMIKTRVQTQSQSLVGVPDAAPTTTTTTTPLLGSQVRSLPPAERARGRLGAMEIAREAYRQGGARVFFRGLAVCSVRAFVVNAVQWAVYEWIMVELGQGRRAGVDAAGSDTTTTSSFREKELI